MGITLRVTKAARSSSRPVVLWDSVAVGQFSCFIQQGCYSGLQHYLFYSMYQTVLLSVRFSHFHNGFCGYIAADVNCLPLIWFLFNGPEGVLRALQLPTGPNTFHTG